MHIYQLISQLGQNIQGYRGVIDKGPGLTAGQYLPSYDGLCLIIQVIFLKKCFQAIFGDFKFRLYDALILLLP